MPAELSSVEAARKVGGDIVARPGRIDVLVHAVGGFAGGKSVADTDDATLHKMLDLNYRSAFFMARAVLPHMRQQGGGRILAVASWQAVEPRAMVGGLQRFESGARGSDPHHRAGERGPRHLGEYGAAGHDGHAGEPGRRP